MVRQASHTMVLTNPKQTQGGIEGDVLCGETKWVDLGGGDGSI
jgi:hypothetical protein